MLQVEALAGKQDNLCLISGTHGMKPSDKRGENQLQAVFLREPCRCLGREVIRMKTPFRPTSIDMDQISGHLTPGGSLSAYLKHSTMWEEVSRQQSVHQFNSRSTIKLEV